MRALLVATLVLSVGSAQAASIGTFLGTPGISGDVRAGEFEKVKIDFSAGFSKPLQLNIGLRSDELEVARIGVWLREQRPILDISGVCAASCAMFVLGSGRAAMARPGTLIAFSNLDEWPASLADQIEAGVLFNSEDERSLASRERLKQRFTAQIEHALALRELRRQHATPPAWVQDFNHRLTGDWVFKDLDFSDERLNVRLQNRHNCLFWVPDEEGLRQAGFDIPGYRSPGIEEAAKILEVPAASVYVGPALKDLPADSLCGSRDKTLQP